MLSRIPYVRCLLPVALDFNCAVGGDRDHTKTIAILITTFDHSNHRTIMDPANELMFIFMAMPLKHGYKKGGSAAILCAQRQHFWRYKHPIRLNAGG